MGKVEWSLLLGSLMLMFCSSCTRVWGRKSASLPLGINHDDNNNHNDNHNHNDNGNLKGGWGSGCNNSTSNRSSGGMAGPEAVCVACGLTTYKAMCEKRLMSYSGVQSATPPELVIISLRLALDAVEQAYGVAIKLLHNASSSSSSPSFGAIRDCMQLMDDSRDQLSLSIAAILALLPSQTRERRANVEEEIENALFSASAALTYQSTCTDGLREHNQNGPAKLAMSQLVNNECGPLVTIALQLVAHLGSHLCSWQDHYSQNGHPSDHPQYPAC